MWLPFLVAGELKKTSSLLAGRTHSEALRIFAAMKLGKVKPVSRINTIAQFGHFERLIGDRPVSEMTRDTALNVMVTVESEGLALLSVRRIRSIFARYVRWLHRRGAIPEDYSDVWYEERMRIEERDLRRKRLHYSRETIARLVAAMPLEKYRRFIMVACLTGQRYRTLENWAWNEIGEDRIWTIPPEHFKQGRELRVPIPDVVWELIQPRGRPGDRVLGLSSYTATRAYIKTHAVAAGFAPDEINLHNFRRTFCSWMKTAGVTRDQIRGYMGWESDHVLLKHYWPEVTDEERWQIARAMDR